MKKLGRLFVIKTRFEAYAVTFALALGAMERGRAYLVQFPGYGGWLLFAACSGSVFMAAAKILDAIRLSELLADQMMPEPSPQSRAIERNQSGEYHGTSFGTLHDRARGRRVSADDRG